MMGILVLLTPRQKIELDSAVLQIVKDLICCTGGTVFDREQFVHIIEIDFETAQRRIFPAARSFSNASTVSMSGISPRQCNR
jgi:hypothetical protein